jgi:predicted RNA-binding Zn-ribbon protein involved in translation (DUF1610 family)
MHTYLKDKKYYEKLYDDITIDICRIKEKVINDAYESLISKGLLKLEGEDKDKDPAIELLKIRNLNYYFEVEWTAGDRWQKRTVEIQKMIDTDIAKDQKLANARLLKEPICMHCQKTGLRIVSKDLMHRDSSRDKDNDQVLFMLDCPTCNKRSAYWEDGAVWEGYKTYCPKCHEDMKYTTKKLNKIITTTYTCNKCGYSYKDKYDMNILKNKDLIDPYYENDKARFCIDDTEGKRYLDGKRNLENMREILSKMDERDKNKPIYDAVDDLKKPKIAELITLLTPSLIKSGYNEFSLDKPEIGRDVFVGFSCLDTKSDRDDFDNKKTLKKLVDKALIETNWRLTVEGISYRLGYLTGRLHAYEHEEDLKKLVMNNKKIIHKQTKSLDINNDNKWKIKTKDGQEIIY